MSAADEIVPTRPDARPPKGIAAYRTIGEVAEDLDLPPHVLRFWESKFPQLKPLKRGGGRRYYRPEDVALLRRIRQSLYQDGYTIRGVRQLLDGNTERPANTAMVPTMLPLFAFDDTPIAAAAASSDEPSPPATPATPPRRPRRRPASPENRAALEEVRRELLEARALLDELLRRRRAP